jgi:hypothetical protein
VSRVLLFAACSCWLVACSRDADNNYQYVPPVQPSGPTGTLEYHWSINGRQVAEDCDAVGAVLFESLVADDGFLVEDVNAPCDDFEATLPLYVDDFVARSAMTTASGTLALGRIVQDVFVIEEAKVTTLVMDFPSAAVPMEPMADAGPPLPTVPTETTPDAGAPQPVDAGVDGGLP